MIKKAINEGTNHFNSSKWGQVLPILGLLLTWPVSPLVAYPEQSFMVEADNLVFKVSEAQLPVSQAEVPARVVVALHPPDFTAKVTIQEQQIAQTQELLMDTLSTEEFRLIHRYETLPGLVGEVSEQGLTALLEQPQVAAVALDLPVELAFGKNATWINADDVFTDLGLTGTGVNIAVLDTGIDLTHPDLAERIVAQHCFNRNGCPPNNTSESDNAQDENGHGTHVAGIIAGKGTTSPQGIAGEVGLVAVRVLSSNGSGFSSDVLAGIDWVIANQEALQVKLLNLSLGGGSYAGACDQADANTLLYAQAVAQARAAGMTIFAASGNSGRADQMMAPACISDVVSVGNAHHADVGRFVWPVCVDSATGPDQVTCSSNSSTALDLLAPGVLIESTRLGGGQAAKSGTSMSTPHATAVAALMLQANPALTPTEIEQILKETGVPVTDLRTGRVTPRLDALAALARVTGNAVESITGRVLLEGRTGYEGTEVFIAAEPCEITMFGPSLAVTPPDGSFTINRLAEEPVGCLRVRHAGYLTGQRPVAEGNLGAITLPGGDMNGDDIVDILDLAFIAARFGGEDAVADINISGVVDILDLVIAAGNYRRSGPVDLWQ